MRRTRGLTSRSAATFQRSALLGPTPHRFGAGEVLQDEVEDLVEDDPGDLVRAEVGEALGVVVGAGVPVHRGEGDLAGGHQRHAQDDLREERQRVQGPPPGFFDVLLCPGGSLGGSFFSVKSVKAPGKIRGPGSERLSPGGGAARRRPGFVVPALRFAPRPA